MKWYLTPFPAILTKKTFQHSPQRVLPFSSPFGRENLGRLRMLE